MKWFAISIFAIVASVSSAKEVDQFLSYAEAVVETASSESTVTVLLNAHLIRPDVDTDDAYKAKKENGIVGHLVIVDEKIVSVVEALEIPLAKAKAKLPTAVVLDLKGKYVMPGLHDMHVHNYGMNADIPNSPIFHEDGSPVEHLDLPGQEAMLYRMAYSGITTHLDLMSYNKATKGLQIQQMSSAKSTLAGSQSQIFMAGGLFHLEDSHHGDPDWLVGSEQHTDVSIPKEVVTLADSEARKNIMRPILLDHFNTFSPDVIKVSYDHNPNRPGDPHIFGMNQEILTDFVNVVNEIDASTPVICHVGTWKDVEECVEAGAKAVTHLPFEKANDPNYQMPEGLLEKMKAKDVFVIPTMTVYTDNSLIKESLFDTTVSYVSVESCEEGDKACHCSIDMCRKSTETGVLNGNVHFFNDPLLKQVIPQALFDHYFDFQFYAGNPWIQWGVDHNKMGYRPRVFQRVIQSGVKVLSGTDTMWEGTFFGFSLHRELELMALTNKVVKTPEKLLSNMEILKTSTSNVHQFLNHDRGVLDQGFIADLLILNQSPVDEIKNTRDIHSVMINGRILDRDSLIPLMKVQ